MELTAEEKQRNTEKNESDNRKVVLFCRDCGAPFSVTIAHLFWHFKVGNCAPSRCPNCQKNKKKD